MYEILIKYPGTQEKQTNISQLHHGPLATWHQCMKSASSRLMSAALMEALISSQDFMGFVLSKETQNKYLVSEIKHTKLQSKAFQLVLHNLLASF